MKNVPKIMRNWNWPAISQVPILANYLAEKIIPAHPKAFTFAPHILDMASFEKDEYVVSFDGHGDKFESLPTVAEIHDWLASQIFILARPRHFVGWWFNKGKYYIDVSTAIIGEDEALSFARKNEQLAIYHPATGQEIPV